MKAVFIISNQSLTEEALEILENMAIRGFTQWTGITGRGSHTGEPHEGTHTWPELNNAIMTIIEEEKVDGLLEKLNHLNKTAEKEGLRAFVWNIESSL